MHGRLARLIALAVLTLGSPLPSGAGGGGVAPAAPASAGWEKVSADFDARLAAARARYSEKLEAIYARYRESGDLDAVLVVRGERTRLREHGLPAAADRVAHPPELASLQDLVLKQHAQWQSERAAALAGFAREKLRELALRQRELTRADKIDEALEVRREIEALKNHPEYGPLLAQEPVAEPPPVTPAELPPVSPGKPAPPRLNVWGFEEGRGTLSLPDHGVQPLHLTGVKWTDGRSGGGLLLDGVASRVSLAAADWQALSVTNSFTLAAWVRAADFKAAQPVFSRQTEAKKGWVMTLNTAGNVMLEVRGGGDKLRLVSKDVLSSGTWHHLAMVLDPSPGAARAEIYVDGLLSASGTAPWTPEVNDLPLLIGAYRWSASYDLHFGGLLDSVVFSSPALKAAEIKALP